MKTKAIELGFEVGTGKPVDVPLLNLAVTGQTQQSGKTTTLEALAARSNSSVIAFVTKRGERSFATGRRIQPYFRDRADWQFVSSIIDATLQEKNKFLRPWIMKICRATRSLADVHREVKTALVKAKGINEGIYTQLDAYLELIVPEIARAHLATRLDLQPGLNVMDVSAYATPMQMLFVQSAIDWVNAHEHGTIVVVPEAWEFIPEGKSSPVKASAVSLVRKGSAIGNRLWADSQDMAGVDKVVLRGCPVWLIGVQREANEIKRNLSNIPAGIARPKPAEIARLDKGQFYACWRDHTIKVYVWPSWMDREQAISFAKGDVEPDSQPEPQLHEEPEMSSAVEQKLDRLLEALERRETAVPSMPTPVPSELSGNGPVSGPKDEEAFYQRIKKRLMDEAPHVIKLLVEKSGIEITIEQKTIEVDMTSARGMIALLIKEGFLDKPSKAGVVHKEMKRRWNYGGIAARAYEQLELLGKMGFVTVESDGYQAVKDMKIRVINK